MQVARDGAEALDLFDAVAPDLVLLDVMLPEGLGHRRLPAAARAVRRCRSSWSPPRAARSTPWSASRSAPTTTSPSPTGCASSSPGCGRCCAGAPATTAVTGSATRVEVGDVRLDPERHEVDDPRRARAPAAEGVRAARAAARERRPGAHPRHAHRPGVGLRLRRRHEDARRARQAAARRRWSPIPATPTRIVTIRGLGYKYDVPKG